MRLLLSCVSRPSFLCPFLLLLLLLLQSSVVLPSCLPPPPLPCPPGERCPAIEQSRSCLNDSCTSDCAVSAWMPWSDCSAACGGGTRMRKRKILSPPVNGGEQCPSTTEEEACNTFSCDGDCVLGEWREWTGCSKPCGGGAKRRTRSVKKKFEGAACPPRRQEVPCNEHLCSIDCEVSEWRAWSTCSVTCGEGEQTRTREIVAEAQGLGSPCPSLQQQRSCFAAVCPTACLVSEWSDWSPCSATNSQCGFGQKKRDRSILTPPTAAGGITDSCPELEVTEECFVPCTAACVLGEWEEWGSCSDLCHQVGMIDPVTSRSRTVLLEAADCPAPAELLQVKSCASLGFQCDVDCEVGEWQPWGACSATCGGGMRQRLRAVTQHPKGKGAACPRLSEVNPCALEDCEELEGQVVTACQYGDWSPYRECDAVCGPGRQRSMRAILAFPSAAAARGLHADEPLCLETERYQPCEGAPCAVDCQVTAWGAWSSCSATCGGGERDRQRSVIRAAAAGGKVCPALTQVQACGTYPCPIDCVTSPWSEWSACSAACGEGTRTRSRRVQTPASADPPGAGCGPLQQNSPCFSEKGACPVDCELSSWTEWSACSETCGTKGRRMRERRVLQQAVAGGRPCAGPYYEESACMQQQPCSVDCVVGEWTDWTPCSISCSRKKTNEVLAAQLQRAGGLQSELQQQQEARQSQLQRPHPLQLREEQQQKTVRRTQEATPLQPQQQHWETDARKSEGGGTSKRERTAGVVPALGKSDSEPRSKRSETERLLRDEESEVSTPLHGAGGPLADGEPLGGAAGEEEMEDTHRGIDIEAWDRDDAVNEDEDEEDAEEDGEVAGGTTRRRSREGGEGDATADSRDGQLEHSPTWQRHSKGEDAAGDSKEEGGRRGREKRGAAEKLIGSEEVEDIPEKGAAADALFRTLQRQVRRGGQQREAGGARRRVLQQQQQLSHAFPTLSEWRADGDEEEEEEEDADQEEELFSAEVNFAPRPAASSLSESALSSSSTSPTRKKSSNSESEETGGGSRSRIRAVLREARDGGTPCPDVMEVDTTCNAEVVCPVDCMYGAWSEWSACGATCGVGTRSRRREVLQQAFYGGKECAEATEDAVDCVAPVLCVEDCAVTEWTEWSSCSATCGGGVRTRDRQVEVAPSNGGLGCPPLREYDACGMASCYGEDCVVSPWTDWSACTASCGGGVQARQRSILVEQRGAGKPCPSLLFERRGCNLFRCRRRSRRRTEGEDGGGEAGRGAAGEENEDEEEEEEGEKCEDNPAVPAMTGGVACKVLFAMGCQRLLRELAAENGREFPPHIPPETRVSDACPATCDVCRECAPGCQLRDLGNRHCDEECNVAACQHDLGDCGGDCLLPAVLPFGVKAEPPTTALAEGQTATFTCNAAGHGQDEGSEGKEEDEEDSGEGEAEEAAGAPEEGHRKDEEEAAAAAVSSAAAVGGSRGAVEKDVEPGAADENENGRSRGSSRSRGKEKKKTSRKGKGRSSSSSAGGSRRFQGYPALRKIAVVCVGRDQPVRFLPDGLQLTAGLRSHDPASRGSSSNHSRGDGILLQRRLSQVEERETGDREAAGQRLQSALQQRQLSVAAGENDEEEGEKDNLAWALPACVTDVCPFVLVEGFQDALEEADEPRQLSRRDQKQPAGSQQQRKGTQAEGQQQHDFAGEGANSPESGNVEAAARLHRSDGDTSGISSSGIGSSSSSSSNSNSSSSGSGSSGSSSGSTTNLSVEEAAGEAAVVHGFSSMNGIYFRGDAYGGYPRFVQDKATEAPYVLWLHAPAAGAAEGSTTAYVSTGSSSNPQQATFYWRITMEDPLDVGATPVAASAGAEEGSSSNSRSSALVAASTGPRCRRPPVGSDAAFDCGDGWTSGVVRSPRRSSYDEAAETDAYILTHEELLQPNVKVRCLSEIEKEELDARLHPPAAAADSDKEEGRGGTPTTYILGEPYTCEDQQQVEAVSGRSCPALKKLLTCDFVLTDAGIANLPSFLPPSATLALACPASCGLCEECAPGCPIWFLANTYCDAACNNAACDFDRGDCGASAAAATAAGTSPLHTAVDHGEEAATAAARQTALERETLRCDDDAELLQFAGFASCEALLHAAAAAATTDAGDDEEAAATATRSASGSSGNEHTDACERLLSDTAAAAPGERRSAAAAAAGGAVAFGGKTENFRVKHACPSKCNACAEAAAVRVERRARRAGDGKEEGEGKEEEGGAAACEDDPAVQAMGYTCKLLLSAASAAGRAGCDTRLQDLDPTTPLPPGIPPITRVKDACPKTCNACNDPDRLVRPGTARPPAARAAAGGGAGGEGQGEDPATACEDAAMVEQMGYTCTLLAKAAAGLQGCETLLLHLAGDSVALPPAVPAEARVKDACPKTCRACNDPSLLLPPARPGSPAAAGTNCLGDCCDVPLLEQETGYSCQQIMDFLGGDCSVQLRSLSSAPLPPHVPADATLFDACPFTCGLCEGRGAGDETAVCEDAPPAAVLQLLAEQPQQHFFARRTGGNAGGAAPAAAAAGAACEALLHAATAEDLGGCEALLYLLLPQQPPQPGRRGTSAAAETAAADRHTRLKDVCRYTCGNCPRKQLLRRQREEEEDELQQGVCMDNPLLVELGYGCDVLLAYAPAGCSTALAELLPASLLLGTDRAAAAALPHSGTAALQLTAGGGGGTATAAAGGAETDGRGNTFSTSLEASDLLLDHCRLSCGVCSPHLEPQQLAAARMQRRPFPSNSQGSSSAGFPSSFPSASSSSHSITAVHSSSWEEPTDSLSIHSSGRSGSLATGRPTSAVRQQQHGGGNNSSSSASGRFFHPGSGRGGGKPGGGPGGGAGGGGAAAAGSGGSGTGLLRDGCRNNPLVEAHGFSCSLLVKASALGCNARLQDLSESPLPAGVPPTVRVKDVCLLECGGCVQVPTCYDGFQNGDEEGVDCGGPCRPCHACSPSPLKELGPAYLIEGRGTHHGSTRLLRCAEDFEKVAGSRHPEMVTCMDGVFSPHALRCDRRRVNVQYATMSIENAADLGPEAVPALYFALVHALRITTPDELRLLAAGTERRSSLREITGGEAAACLDDPRVEQMGYSCSLLSSFCEEYLHALAKTQGKELPAWLPADAKVKDACAATCGVCDPGNNVRRLAAADSAAAASAATAADPAAAADMDPAADSALAAADSAAAPGSAAADGAVAGFAAAGRSAAVDSGAAAAGVAGAAAASAEAAPAAGSESSPGRQLATPSSSSSVSSSSVSLRVPFAAGSAAAVPKAFPAAAAGPGLQSVQPLLLDYAVVWTHANEPFVSRYKAETGPRFLAALHQQLLERGVLLRPASSLMSAAGSAASSPFAASDSTSSSSSSSPSSYAYPSASLFTSAAAAAAADESGGPLLSAAAALKQRPFLVSLDSPVPVRLSHAFWKRGFAAASPPEVARQLFAVAALPLPTTQPVEFSLLQQPLLAPPHTLPAHSSAPDEEGDAAGETAEQETDAHERADNAYARSSRRAEEREGPPSLQRRVIISPHAEVQYSLASEKRIPIPLSPLLNSVVGACISSEARRNPNSCCSFHAEMQRLLEGPCGVQLYGQRLTSTAVEAFCSKRVGGSRCFSSFLLLLDSYRTRSGPSCQLLPAAETVIEAWCAQQPLPAAAAPPSASAAAVLLTPQGIATSSSSAAEQQHIGGTLSDSSRPQTPQISAALGPAAPAGSAAGASVSTAASPAPHRAAKKKTMTATHEHAANAAVGAADGSTSSAATETPPSSATLYPNVYQAGTAAPAATAGSTEQQQPPASEALASYARRLSGYGERVDPLQTRRSSPSAFSSAGFSPARSFLSDVEADATAAGRNGAAAEGGDAAAGRVSRPSVSPVFSSAAPRADAAAAADAKAAAQKQVKQQQPMTALQRPTVAFWPPFGGASSQGNAEKTYCFADIEGTLEGLGIHVLATRSSEELDIICSSSSCFRSNVRYLDAVTQLQVGWRLLHAQPDLLPYEEGEGSSRSYSSNSYSSSSRGKAAGRTAAAQARAAETDFPSRRLGRGRGKTASHAAASAADTAATPVPAAAAAGAATPGSAAAAVPAPSSTADAGAHSLLRAGFEVSQARPDLAEPAASSSLLPQEQQAQHLQATGSQQQALQRSSLEPHVSPLSQLKHTPAEHQQQQQLSKQAATQEETRGSGSREHPQLQRSYAPSALSSSSSPSRREFLLDVVEDGNDLVEEELPSVGGKKNFVSSSTATTIAHLETHVAAGARALQHLQRKLQQVVQTVATRVLLFPNSTSESSSSNSQTASSGDRSESSSSSWENKVSQGNSWASERSPLNNSRSGANSSSRLAAESGSVNMKGSAALPNSKWWSLHDDFDERQSSSSSSTKFTSESQQNSKCNGEVACENSSSVAGEASSSSREQKKNGSSRTGEAGRRRLFAESVGGWQKRPTGRYQQQITGGGGVGGSSSSGGGGSMRMSRFEGPLGETLEEALDLLCMQVEGDYCQQTLILLAEESPIKNPSLLVQPCASRCFVPITGLLGGLIEAYGERYADPFHQALGSILRAYGRFYCTQNEQGKVCGETLFNRLQHVKTPKYEPEGVEETAFPLCQCPRSFIQDGECDRSCFNEACGWDGEDCLVRRMFPEVLEVLLSLVEPSCNFYSASFTCTPRCRMQYQRLLLSKEHSCCLNAGFEVLAAVWKIENRHPAVLRLSSSSSNRSSAASAAAAHASTPQLSSSFSSSSSLNSSPSLLFTAAESVWRPERTIAFLEQSCGMPFDRTCSSGRARQQVVLRMQLLGLAAGAVLKDKVAADTLVTLLAHTVAQRLRLVDSDVPRVVLRPAAAGVEAEVFVDAGVYADRSFLFLKNEETLRKLEAAVSRRLHTLDLDAFLLQQEPLRQQQQQHEALRFPQQQHSPQEQYYREQQDADALQREQGQDGSKTSSGGSVGYFLQAKIDVSQITTRSILSPAVDQSAAAASPSAGIGSALSSAASSSSLLQLPYAGTLGLDDMLLDLPAEGCSAEELHQTLHPAYSLLLPPHRLPLPHHPAAAATASSRRYPAAVAASLGEARPAVAAAAPTQRTFDEGAAGDHTFLPTAKVGSLLRPQQPLPLQRISAPTQSSSDYEAAVRRKGRAQTAVLTEADHMLSKHRSNTSTETGTRPSSPVDSSQSDARRKNTSSESVEDSPVTRRNLGTGIYSSSSGNGDAAGEDLRTRAKSHILSLPLQQHASAVASSFPLPAKPTSAVAPAVASRSAIPAAAGALRRRTLLSRSLRRLSAGSAAAAAGAFVSHMGRGSSSFQQRVYEHGEAEPVRCAGAGAAGSSTAEGYQRFAGPAEDKVVCDNGTWVLQQHLTCMRSCPSLALSLAAAAAEASASPEAAAAASRDPHATAANGSDGPSGGGPAAGRPAAGQKRELKLGDAAASSTEKAASAWYLLQTSSSTSLSSLFFSMGQNNSSSSSRATPAGSPRRGPAGAAPASVSPASASFAASSSSSSGPSSSSGDGSQDVVLLPTDGYRVVGENGQQHFPHSSELLLYCAAGYAAAAADASPTRMRCSNGVWTGRRLRCLQLCLPFPDLGPAYVVQGGGGGSSAAKPTAPGAAATAAPDEDGERSRREEGDWRVVSCSKGYYPQRRSYTAVCHDGAWMYSQQPAPFACTKASPPDMQEGATGFQKILLQMFSSEGLTGLIVFTLLVLVAAAAVAAAWHFYFKRKARENFVKREEAVQALQEASTCFDTTKCSSSSNSSSHSAGAAVGARTRESGETETAPATAQQEHSQADPEDYDSYVTGEAARRKAPLVAVGAAGTAEGEAGSEIEEEGLPLMYGPNEGVGAHARSRGSSSSRGSKARADEEMQDFLLLRLPNSTDSSGFDYPRQLRKGSEGCSSEGSRTRPPSLPPAAVSSRAAGEVFAPAAAHCSRTLGGAAAGAAEGPAAAAPSLQQQRRLLSTNKPLLSGTYSSLLTDDGSAAAAAAEVFGCTGDSSSNGKPSIVDLQQLHAQEAPQYTQPCQLLQHQQTASAAFSEDTLVLPLALRSGTSSGGSQRGLPAPGTSVQASHRRVSDGEDLEGHQQRAGSRGRVLQQLLPGKQQQVETPGPLTAAPSSSSSSSYPCSSASFPSCFAASLPSGSASAGAFPFGVRQRDGPTVFRSTPAAGGAAEAARPRSSCSSRAETAGDENSMVSNSSNSIALPHESRWRESFSFSRTTSFQAAAAASCQSDSPVAVSSSSSEADTRQPHEEDDVDEEEEEQQRPQRQTQ